MVLIFNQLSILYIFLFIGWIIGKNKKNITYHTDVLSVLLVNVFLPCKIFNTFSVNFSLSYFIDNYYLPLAALSLLLVLSIISIFVSKALTKNQYERKIYIYSFSITNYAYLGYALIGTVFGDEFLASFMLFAIPFIIYTYTIGYSLLAGSKIHIKNLLNLNTISIVLGLFVGLSGFSIPVIFKSTISMASACVGPLSMLLTGITLSTFALKELLLNKTAYIFTFFRLCVIPATAYIICRCLSLDMLIAPVLIITCMPCGLNTIVFPKLINEDCKPGARLAILTHLFSIFTIPFWLSLIQ